jgi:hypothetical protein
LAGAADVFFAGDGIEDGEVVEVHGITPRYMR